MEKWKNTKSEEMQETERKSLWKRGKCEKFVEICGKREKSVKNFVENVEIFREKFLSALYIFSFFFFFKVQTLQSSNLTVLSG